MTILRFHINNKNETEVVIYKSGKEVERISADSIKLASQELNKKDIGKIDGIYIFEGPAGYTRLRAMHAYAQGFARGAGIPITSYKEWKGEFSRSIPEDSAIKQVYDE